MIPRIIEQLKMVLEKITSMKTNVKERNNTSRQNISLLKFNLSFIKIINIKIIKYNEEVELLKN